MKILFAGTPEFAASHLAALLKTDHELCAVITRPDKPGKRGKRLIPSPVKTLALTHKLPILQPSRLAPEHLTPYGADLMIVVAYGQMLSAAVLGTPRLGCVNVHASLLPRWRGAAPIQHAILAGDTRTGISIMQMDAGLDTGPVLAMREVALDPEETTATLTEKLAGVGPDLLVAVLERLEQGTITPTAQDEQHATWAGKITKDDARLDWHDTAAGLARAVRAFNPDPVAWTMLGDLRVKIWGARRAATAEQSPPGTILALSAGGITVACGEGALLLTRIQLPLGKGSILNGKDVLNARADLLGPGKQFS